METRKHIHEEDFPVPCEKMFEILVTPSAICKWWGAERAIVLAEENGLWAAAWGENEDAPDYISTFTIARYDPPRSIYFNDAKYFSKDGGLPFDADLTAEFIVMPTDSGCKLKVIQDGFPTDARADDFYDACETGWKNTFEGIRGYF